MKKFLSFAFALFLSISVSAQTTLTEAIDFSSTAHNGEEINLFEILDGGQYVLIDFFFSTCGPCKEYAPRIVDAYYMLGCNEGDVYFMEVSPTDNNKPYSTDSWINQFNIPYPTLHTETGGVTGDSIYRMYEIAACPTMLLIAPDRKIVVNDYHPESAEAMVEYFKTSFGIEENFCGKVSQVSISKTRVNMEDGQGNVLEASTKVHVDFRANAATEKFYYTISESANLTAEDVIANGTLAESKEFQHTFENLTPSTTYFVYAQPINIDGGNGEKSVIETRTLCPGDEGEVKVELSVQVTAAYVIANATPNESTSEYHFGFVKKSYYDESETNQFKYLFALANDDYPLCDADSYQVPIKNEETGAPRFDPNTPYYVVAVGRNGEGEWFAPSIKEFMVEQPVGPATVSLNVKPMSTSVTITATPNDYTVEFHFGLVTKVTFDNVGVDNLIGQIRNDGYPSYATTSADWTDLKPETEYVALASALNAGGEWGETTIVEFTTLAAGEAVEEVNAGFNIYPNPAKSMINIESSLSGEAQVSIYDMTGRCVKQTVVEMSNASINIENLNKGVYFVAVQQDRNYNIQKLVVE